MKLFIDTANLGDIEHALTSGWVRGITTNPSLLAKEPKGNYLEHMKKIVELSQKYGGDFSLSVEVFSDEPKEMIAQAKQFVKDLHYRHLAIKIPVSYKERDYLGVVRELAKEGIAVNCTAGVTSLQMMMAAAAGSKYVSIFYNRIRDGLKDEKYAAERSAAISTKAVEEADFDPNNVVRETRALIGEYSQAEIIVGSIRTVLDVKQAGMAGAHIVTASPKVLHAALHHFKTDEAVELFLRDFESWIK